MRFEVFLVSACPLEDIFDVRILLFIGNSDNDSQRGNETKPVDEPSSPSNKVGTIEMRRLGTSSPPDNSSSSVSAADQSVLIIWEKDVDTKPVNENVKKSQ